MLRDAVTMLFPVVMAKTLLALDHPRGRRSSFWAHIRPGLASQTLISIINSKEIRRVSPRQKIKARRPRVAVFRGRRSPPNRRFHGRVFTPARMSKSRHSTVDVPTASECAISGIDNNDRDHEVSRRDFAIRSVERSRLDRFQSARSERITVRRERESPACVDPFSLVGNIELKLDRSRVRQR